MKETAALLLVALRRNPNGASEALLRQVLSLADNALPSDYLAFLQQSDGGEGFLRDGGYIAIWPVAEVLGVRDEDGFSDAPWLLPFASDGSNAAFAFDLESPPESRRVVKVDYLDVGDRNMEEFRGDTFLDFLLSIANDRSDD